MERPWRPALSSDRIRCWHRIVSKVNVKKEVNLLVVFKDLHKL